MDVREKYCELRDKILEKEFNHLNDEQKQAVFTVKGPVLVVAGAGSGKTTALTNRIYYLLNYGDIYKSSYVPDDLNTEDLKLMEEWLNESSGSSLNYQFAEDYSRLLKFRKIEPWSFIAITFTNKAAEEMKQRVDCLESFAGKLWVSTFHSACVRILRRHVDFLGLKGNFTIYDAADKKTVIKECLEDLDLDPKKNSPNAIANEISNAKNRLLTPEKYRKAAYDFFQEITANVYTRYQDKLWKNNAFDFDDLIMSTVELLTNNEELLRFYQDKFKYIMVDEYQDTNYAQYIFIKLLAAGHRNICVVGDPDQGIYGWRGADIKNILDFEKDYPDAKTVKLERNYRSTKRILKTANEVIKQNTARKEKDLWTHNKEGEHIKLYRGETEYSEARFVISEIQRLLKDERRTYKDFAVFYRTHAQSRVFEEELLKNNISYEVIGGLKFYERKEIKDIIAYLRIISNPADDTSLARIINTPKRKIGKNSWNALQSYAADNSLSAFQALERAEEIKGLGAGALKSMKKFANIISSLQQKLETKSLTNITSSVLEETEYLRALQEEKTVEAETRIENLQEFLSVTEEYDKNKPAGSLDDFLSELALITDVDQHEENQEKVTLMTMHAAKGLEFLVVFICGMEEAVFPHYNSLTDESKLQEERRLCHVAMTRAKEKLYLVNSVQRTLYGTTRINPPSRFIEEIPETMIEDISQDKPSESKEKVQEEEEAAAFVDNLRSGEFVFHPKWGKGTVVQNKSGVVSVAFPGIGVKHLDLEYAPLKKAQH